MPTIPPKPWQGNTSSVSSSLVLERQYTAVFEITAAITPMKILCGMATKPAAGVMATSPTTAPIQNPNTEGFFPFITSKNIQDNPAAAAAVFVVANAETESELAAPAEPALNPNQPNHSNPVPINT